MDFIFMLTRGDKTVEDCLSVFDGIAPLGLKHVGFKDVGVEPETLVKLTERIRGSGAISYMEVVSETPEACLRSARVARELGIDRLLGGTDVAAISDIIAGTHTDYYPFPGFPQGHPTRLGGTPQDVTAHCRNYRAAGCAGADIARLRAFEVPLNSTPKYEQRRVFGVGKRRSAAGETRLRPRNPLRSVPKWLASSITNISTIRSSSLAWASVCSIAALICD